MIPQMTNKEEKVHWSSLENAREHPHYFEHWGGAGEKVWAW